MSKRPLVSCLAILTSVLTAFSAYADPVRQKQILSVEQFNSLPAHVMSVEAKTRAVTHIQTSRAAKIASAPKVGEILRNFADRAAGDASVRHPLLKIKDGNIHLRMRMADSVADVSGMLTNMGLHVHRIEGQIAHISCPVDGLADALTGAETNGAIVRIEPVLGELVHTGSVLSEGDAALGVDFARGAFGVDGTGVSVCVISDGTAGTEQSILSGDLPSDKDGNPAIDLCDPNVVPTENSGAEGTAMLEIIHDLAPGARLGFCPAFGPAAEDGLADAILYLSRDAFDGEGCDIVVDDVAYLTEPYFEDGVVARAVNTAVKDHNTLYFSSAGNSGDNHYESDFVDSFPFADLPIPLLNLHDFGLASGGTSDVDWAGVVGGAGNFFAVFMQWSDKFGAAGNDYDVYLFDINGFPAGDPAGEFPIGGNGVAAQDGDDDPLEIAFIVNEDGAPPIGDVKPFFIVVDRFAGDPAKVLEMNFNGLFAVDPAYNVAEGSIWGHAAARRAFSVAATGAVFNLDGTPNPLLDIIEPFSSQGPSRIFWDRKGRPLELSRRTPTVTATDGVSVTGFGGFPSVFYGTSASAPHAAAIAALVKQADPSMDFRKFTLLIRRTSDDRGARKFDNVWGNGLIDVVELLGIASDGDDK